MKIQHKGLRRLWERDDPRGVPAEMAKRLRRRLALLRLATGPHDLTDPTCRLHPLSGRMAGWWSLRVSGNWRLVFRFDGREAVDVDLVDYH